VVPGESTPRVVRDARCALEPSTTRGAVGSSAPAKFCAEVSPTERRRVGRVPGGSWVRLMPVVPGKSWRGPGPGATRGRTAGNVAA
jgi:hypothetical protein